jgi:hypothetical protein
LIAGWLPADIELRDKVKRYFTFGVHGPPLTPQLLHPCYQLFMEFTSGMVFEAADLIQVVQTFFATLTSILITTLFSTFIIFCIQRNLGLINLKSEGPKIFFF